MRRFSIFYFFWISEAGFKLRSKRRAVPFIPRGWILQDSCWIPDEMTCCEPKNDFLKKIMRKPWCTSSSSLPRFHWICRNLSKLWAVAGKLWHASNRWIVHAMWSTIYVKWGGAFSKLISCRCFTKLQLFGSWKMENGFSVQGKGKVPLATLFAIPRCTHVHNMGALSQTMPWFWSCSSSFALKAKNLRTW